MYSKYWHSSFVVYWGFIEFVRSLSTILHSLEAGALVGPHLTCLRVHAEDVAQLGGEHRHLTTELTPGAQRYL